MSSVPIPYSTAHQFTETDILRAGIIWVEQGVAAL